MELNNLTLDESREFSKSIGYEAYRGNQIFSFFNKNKGLDPDESSVLSKDLKTRLKAEHIREIKILDRLDSRKDKTKKYLFLLEDKNVIESVFMSYEDRNTLCISSQVGCRMACSFCASTKEGFKRNLLASEMLNQVYMVEKDLGLNIDNIVIMGIGEPLDNFDQLLKFISIINDPLGRNLGQRHITISTSGLADRIKDLADQGLSVNLAISLHYPYDSMRREYMPVARKFSIGDLLEACDYYFDKTGRRVTYEYIVLSGINDREEDADQLERLFFNKNIHINLIPLNPIREFKGYSSSDRDAKNFKKKLDKRNIKATIRKKQGADIDAACGQLRNYYEKEVKF